MKKQWLKRLAGACICALCLCTLPACKKETEEVAIEQVTEPEFEVDDIRALEVTKDGEVIYELSYEPREDRQSFLFWDMPVPYQSVATVDTEEIYKLFQVFAGIDFESSKQSETNKELADSDTKITVSYYDADKGSKDSEEYEKNEDASRDQKLEHPDPNCLATILVGEKMDNAYECTIEGDDTVYRIKDFAIDAVLNEKPYDMILKIPFILDKQSVKQVNVEWNDKKAELKSDKNGQSINGKSVDEETYNSVYSMLLQCSMTGEIPVGSDVAKGKKELVKLQYTRTKKDFEEYTVTFYEYDEQNAVVDVNGKVAFLVSQEDVHYMIGCLDKL